MFVKHNTPVAEEYELTSHSWKLSISWTIIMDWAVVYANPWSTVRHGVDAPKV